MTAFAASAPLAAADLAQTFGGIAFWGTLLAINVILFGAALVSISRTQLSSRSRRRWIWLVVLAPGIGIILWFAFGRPATRNRPSNA
ncbi:PLDc N-terminal domain-containing protein [Salinispora vitiensis]|uniref:PLDc N-terminal domain-containing protein n=1 Tax=Salinispora vitiensis TaxID=999544 RepID=UPI00037D6615|nr:PLDc N-terminal domain-containing protein [Salinispora vitiensis]